MVKMLIDAFYESFIYKAAVLFGNACLGSRLKAVADTLSRWYEESMTGKGFKCFAAKKPAYQCSVYQQTLNKISASASVVTSRLHSFFGGIIGGSRICAFYFGFIGSKPSNIMRVTGIFGFYFFLTATALSVFGIIGAGRAAISFSTALVFLLCSLLAGKITAAAQNSFFVKLFLGLIK